MTPFTLRTHQSHVRSRMSSNDPSKIFGHLKRAHIRKCRIQGAQEQALVSQLTRASWAFVKMRFKSCQRFATEFAVEIGSDLLELTFVIGLWRDAHLHRFLLNSSDPATHKFAAHRFARAKQAILYCS